MFENFNWGENLKNFYDSLGIMGYSMLGIFIVIGIIFLSIYLLSLVPEKKDSENKE